MEAPATFACLDPATNAIVAAPPASSTRRTLPDTPLASLAQADPLLAAPIVPDMPDLLAEAALAAAREQARSVGDVLLRRTRLGLLAARQLTREPVGRVAGAMAGHLGWDGARIEAEIDRFAQEARAEGIAFGA